MGERVGKTKSCSLCITPVCVTHTQVQVTQPSTQQTFSTPFPLRLPLAPPSTLDWNSPMGEPAWGHQELLQGFSCSQCPLDGPERPLA